MRLNNYRFEGNIVLRYPSYGAALSFLILVLGSSSWGQEISTGSAATVGANESADQTSEFAELYDEWLELLDNLREIQRRYRTAEEAELSALRSEFQQKFTYGNEDLLPRLTKAALSRYKGTQGGDEEVNQFLISALSDAIRRDNYEPAMELAQEMSDVAGDTPQLYDLAGIAAFATGDFSNAKKFLQAAQQSGEISEAGSTYLREVDQYIQYWKEEQKIRQQEAAADDLPRVRLKTSKGDIVLELFENEAPQTVGNFISLVESGFYDGLTFHRVLPGFMAQGGCPKGTGTGGPGYTIYCECTKPNHRKHFRGSLSMAKAAAPNTGGSQFFLTFLPTPHLNGKHTVFGRVIEGLDVLAKLQRVDPGIATPSIKRDRIISAEVLRKREHEYRPTMASRE